MQIEKLLKKQVQVWDSKVMAIPYASMQYKEHLKQFIDGLVEKLEEMKKVILNKIDSEDDKFWKRNRNHDIGYNLAIDHDISHLKEIRKQLE